MKTLQPEPIDVIVCYYNPNNHSHIRMMTMATVTYLNKHNRDYLNIIVSDGGKNPDTLLKELLEINGIEYLHSGKEMSFAETYNFGILNSKNEIVALIANDIFIETEQIIKLSSFLKPGVGCVMPFLSYSDYGTQILRKFRPDIIYPSGMTLNVNIFYRSVLKDIDYIPREMSGAFTDMLLFIRMKNKGYSVLIKKVGVVIHLAKQTLKTGTSVSYSEDSKLFSELYPSFWKDPIICHSKLAQKTSSRILFKIYELIPNRITKTFGLFVLVCRIEPYITAERGYYFKRIKKIFFNE